MPQRRIRLSPVWRLLLLAGLFPASQLSAFSEETTTPAFVSSPRRLLTAPELSDAPDEWIDRSLQWVNYILQHYPPGLPEHPVRRAALIRLDDILHIESAPRKELVQAFYRKRMEGAVADIEQTKVNAGLRIWKLYDLGFLVRSPAVSITFDIVVGGKDLVTDRSG